MYCRKCGKEVDVSAVFCPNCGTRLENGGTSQSSKSQVASGLLAIFLGTLGIHNFYLGYTGKGITQLLLTLVGVLLFGLGPLISGIWAFVEAILIFMGRIDDASGNPLK